jgi:hypothetical protein
MHCNNECSDNLIGNCKKEDNITESDDEEPEIVMTPSIKSCRNYFKTNLITRLADEAKDGYFLRLFRQFGEIERILIYQELIDLRLEYNLNINPSYLITPRSLEVQRAQAIEACETIGAEFIKNELVFGSVLNQ